MWEKTQTLNCMLVQLQLIKSTQRGRLSVQVVHGATSLTSRHSLEGTQTKRQTMGLLFPPCWQLVSATSNRCIHVHVVLSAQYTQSDSELLVPERLCIAACLAQGCLTRPLPGAVEPASKVTHAL